MRAMPIIAAFFFLNCDAKAQWYKKNIALYSYKDTSRYITTGNIINVRCNLEKGYRNRILVDEDAESKVKALGLVLGDGVYYRVLSFTPKDDSVGFSGGICRVEIIREKSNANKH